MLKLNVHHLEDISLMLKALADLTRLKIMQVLHEKERCVGDIVKAVGTGQANISKHLQLLTLAHLVKSRREGMTIHYSLAGPFVENLCESICKGYSTIFSKKYGVVNKKSRKP